MSSFFQRVTVKRVLGGNTWMRSVERDWLGRRAVIIGAFAFAAVEVYIQARGSEYGLDFRGSTWQADRALMDGRSRPGRGPVAEPT